MKILFHGYNTCCLNESGGVQNRMRTICRLLNEREGVEAELFNPYESKIQDCDIIHFFMLRYENYDFIKFAKKFGIKIVLSSIINLKGGRDIDRTRFFLNKLPITSVSKMKFEIMQMSDIIITESEKESMFIAQHFKINVEKLKNIPNGISIQKYEGKEIYEVLGETVKFAIILGRFDSNKNQLNVIRALKGTGIHVVFLGGPVSWDQEYYEECLKCAGKDKHFHFLGWVEHNSNLFLSALSHADTLIMPSYNETFGLAALEAGAVGCKLSLSETLPILDYSSFTDCNRFNPHSIDSIKKNVTEIMNKPKTDEIANKIVKEFSWKSVIDQHIDIYNSILK